MSNAAVKRSNSGEIIRGGLLSFVFATILVLVFSLIVKLTNMSATAVPIVNQVIKILSVFLGVFFSLKNKERHFVRFAFRRAQLCGFFPSRKQLQLGGIRN